MTHDVSSFSQIISGFGRESDILSAQSQNNDFTWWI